MRRLIYVPMVHDPFSEAYKCSLDEAIGSNPDKSLVKAFRDGQNKYWDKVDMILSQEIINKIYQDSCFDYFGLDSQIEKYMSKRHVSRNYNALVNLLLNGSKLMITESCEARNEGYFEDDRALQILPRDNYIATNIETTLLNGETGVLFIGLSHKVDKIISEKYPSISIERINGSIEYLVNIFEELKAKAKFD